MERHRLGPPYGPANGALTPVGGSAKAAPERYFVMARGGAPLAAPLVTMAHSAPDAHRTIQPVPTIPIAAASPPTQFADYDDDSFRPVTGPDGFASDAPEAMPRAGVPWEQRPLSRRGILGWTIGAIVLLVATVTTVGLALARNGSNSTTHAAALHGAEATQVENEAQPALAPSARQATPEAPSAAPTPIPLESLPKLEAKAPQRTAVAPRHSKAVVRGLRKAPAVAARAPLVAPKAKAITGKASVRDRTVTSAR